MIEKKIPTSFDVQVYGDLVPYSPTISKARVRIFYRGLNRNWSYITDEYANKIISSLPYAPVKGIYDDEGQDYTDHGNGIRSLGKAYGVIPENNHGEWERHIDTDGIERIYYCCDILLWTALYENAKKIPGKGQSMELDEKSIKGEWTDFGTFEAFVFTEGNFLGLQVLGDNVEPCFEGAAFYALKQDFSEIMKIVKDYDLKEETHMNKENTVQNDKNTELNTQTTVQQVANNTVNTNGEGTITNAAQTTEPAAQTTEPTAQTGDPTAQTVAEPAAQTGDPTAQTATGASVLVAEANTQNFEKMYKELKTANEALQKNFEKISAEFSGLKDKFTHLTAERDALKEFKDTAENKEKEAIIDKYSQIIPTEIIANYKAKISDFSAIELDKELCFEAHKNDNLEPQTANFSYKNNESEGLSRIQEYLNNYKIN